MTSGPEHYRKAETLLGQAGSAHDAEGQAAFLAEAQVHATLALVAAQCDETADPIDGPTWREVTGS